MLSAGKAVARVVAGDDAPESEFSRRKNQLRRIWKIGQNESNDLSCRCAGCATASRRPALATCMEALGKVQKKPCRPTLCGEAASRRAVTAAPRAVVSSPFLT